MLDILIPAVTEEKYKLVLNYECQSRFIAGIRQHQIATPNSFCSIQGGINNLHKKYFLVNALKCNLHEN